jgi:hypothetical protein
VVLIGKFVTTARSDHSTSRVGATAVTGPPETMRESSPPGCLTGNQHSRTLGGRANGDTAVTAGLPTAVPHVRNPIIAITDVPPAPTPRRSRLAAFAAFAVTDSPVAFERLYDQAQPAAFSLALRICRDRTLAEDVVQQAFLEAWRNTTAYDQQRGIDLNRIRRCSRH